MNKAKLETEYALEAKALPLDVVIECLTLRESRQSIDVVRDGVEAELHKVTNTYVTNSSAIRQYELRNIARNRRKDVGRPVLSDKPG